MREIETVLDRELPIVQGGAERLASRPATSVVVIGSLWFDTATSRSGST